MLAPISVKSLQLTSGMCGYSTLHPMIANPFDSKHMVSLRGSKFGSRVALLCCNPSHVTRPGPGAGVQVNRFGPPSEERFSVNNHSGGRFNRGGHWNSANYVSYR